MLQNVFFCFHFVNSPNPHTLHAAPSPSPLPLCAYSEKFAYLCDRWSTARLSGRHHAPGTTMDKKKAELIQILWTVIKVAVGYLIGYLTNNPEAASQVSAFLNY